MPSAPKVKESGGTSGKGEAKPSTKTDLKLREKHTKDSIRYNESHAKDHAAAVKKARKQLSETQQKLKKIGGKRGY